MRTIEDMIADANRVAFLCDSEHRGCSCNHGDILAAARDTINELVNELKRMQNTDREKISFFREALKKAVEIVDDICGEECCEYGHGDEIGVLRLISENKKPCPHFYIDKDGWDMCAKYDAFCKPRFDGCKTDCILFPEDEKGVICSCDLSDKPAETVGIVFQPGSGAIRTVRGVDMLIDFFYRNSTKKVCGTCALFYANGHCHKDPKNPVIMRSGEPACADYHSRSACNNGDCERHKLGAEPCVGCRFCDEKGNI